MQRRRSNTKTSYRRDQCHNESRRRLGENYNRNRNERKNIKKTNRYATQCRRVLIHTAIVIANTQKRVCELHAYERVQTVRFKIRHKTARQPNGRGSYLHDRIRTF